MTTEPGVSPASAVFICPVKSLPEAAYGPIGSTRGLEIYILNLVTLNFASKSKLSNEADTTVCPRNWAAEIRPPSFPATRAVGLGIRFTRNFEVPKFCTFPSIVAVTCKETSPGEDTRAIYLASPLAVRLTPAPDIRRLSAGTPGADIEIGLSTPIYNTFIASGETTADGFATWNVIGSVSYILTVPSVCCTRI